MPGDFDDALDTIFDTIDGAEVVTVTPTGGGDTFDVTIMPSGADRIDVIVDTPIKSENALTFEARIAEWESPAKGDTFAYKGTTYKVKESQIIDDLRLLHFIECTIA